MMRSINRCSDETKDSSSFISRQMSPAYFSLSLSDSSRTSVDLITQVTSRVIDGRPPIRSSSGSAVHIQCRHSFCYSLNSFEKQPEITTIMMILTIMMIIMTMTTIITMMMKVNTTTRPSTKDRG